MPANYNNNNNNDNIKKIDNYLDLARELIKLWYMKVTVMPIVSGTLGTVTKGLVQGLGDLEIRRRVESIQTAAFIRSARILRGFLEASEKLLSLRLQ